MRRLRRYAAMLTVAKVHLLVAHPYNAATGVNKAMFPFAVLVRTAFALKYQVFAQGPTALFQQYLHGAKRRLSHR